jgi:hypothetical protein
MMAETFQGNNSLEFPFATRWLFFVSQPGLALLKAASRPCLVLSAVERRTGPIPVDMCIH